MDRDLFVEEIKKKVNSTLNPKPNEYQTAAPIIGENNAPNIYLTVADMEKIKESIESYSRDYSVQFNNLLTYIDRVTAQYGILINKIDSLKDYIESLQNTMNPNKGKINGVEVDDITYYTRRDEDSYYQKELMPKLTTLYENSITYATTIIENAIIEAVNELNESDIGKEIVTDEFLKSINYYQHFNSVSKIESAFKIEKAPYSTAEISDNGTVQIIKTDPAKNSLVKAITRGNEVVDVIIASSNEEGGGVVLQTLGKVENTIFGKNTNPIYPEIFKSDVKGLKTAWLSEVVNIDPSILDQRTSDINHEMTKLAAITVSDDSLLIKNGDLTIANSTDGKVYIDNIQADFSVDSIKVHNGSICVVSKAKDLWVLGSNANNRLGLGKNVTRSSGWERIKIGEKVESVFITDFYTLVKGVTNWYIAGNTGMKDAKNSKSFVSLTDQENVIWYFTDNIFIYNNKSGKLLALGDNNYGKCGVGSEEDYIAEPTEITLPENYIFVGNVFTSDERTFYTHAVDTTGTNGITLFGFGYQDNYQLGHVCKDPSVPNLIIGKTISSMNPGLVITEDDELYVFGDNRNGRLGVNSDKKNIPLTLLRSIDEKNLFNLKNNILMAYIENDSLVVVTKDKYLYTSGKNDHYQLGLGHNNEVRKLTLVDCDDINGKIKIAKMIKDQLFILANSGNEYRLFGCGNNINGNLAGPETEIKEISDLGLPLKEDIEIHVYSGNTFIKEIDGDYYCAGLNQYGQLGRGDREKSPSFQKIVLPNNEVPAHIRVLKNYIKDNVYIITESGSVYASGLNFTIQNGSGVTENYITEFKRVDGLKNIKFGYNDGRTGYFVDTKNDLYAVGDNSFGKTGVEGMSGKSSVGYSSESGFDIQQMNNAAIVTDDITVLEKEF